MRLQRPWTGALVSDFDETSSSFKGLRRLFVTKTPRTILTPSYGHFTRRILFEGRSSRASSLKWPSLRSDVHVLP